MKASRLSRGCMLLIDVLAAQCGPYHNEGRDGKERTAQGGRNTHFHCLLWVSFTHSLIHQDEDSQSRISLTLICLLHTHGSKDVLFPLHLIFTHKWRILETFF